MERQILKGFVLLCLLLTALHADDIPDVSLRFHAQWNVGDQERQKLQEKYGITRVNFDKKGEAIPNGLSSAQLARWKRLYELCMRDGCYYCEADEGSCESGTCGFKNSYCRPHMGGEGLPQCGVECADYAFISTLI